MVKNTASKSTLSIRKPAPAGADQLKNIQSDGGERGGVSHPVSTDQFQARSRRRADHNSAPLASWMTDIATIKPP